MRPFVSVLISVALASFIGAAPLHGNHPASVPNTLASSKLPSGLQSSNPAVGGQLGSVVGNVASVRDFKSQIEGAVNSIGSKLNARTSTAGSVPTILANLTAEMESCAAAMNYVNPMNITAELIEVTFLGMNKLVNGAICAMEELIGEVLIVILPALDGGDAAEADSQVAAATLEMFDIIYNAAESASENADSQNGKESKGSGKGKATRSGSGNAMDTLFSTTLPTFTTTLDSLIPNLDTTSFLPMFSPFESSSTSEPVSGIEGRSKYALLTRDDSLVCH